MNARARLSSILAGDSVMKRAYVLAIATLVIISLDVIGVRSEGNPARGQRVFGACAACHSLQSDQNMTGPSLADVWNRKVGSLASFSRYSPALKSASIVWNDKTLDEWINEPPFCVASFKNASRSARCRASLIPAKAI